MTRLSMGSGFKHIRESLEAEGLPFPKITNDDECIFFIEFARPASAQKGSQKTAQKIIEEIKRNPEVSRKELAVCIGLTADGIKYHLTKMQKNGLLHRVGPDKGGHREVIIHPPLIF